jgi:prevent-host-death family protein
MRFTDRVKPISYFKANAAELLGDLVERREPLLITQNGEAKAVLQDLASFEEARETLAMLKLLALGDRDIREERTYSAREVIESLRSKSDGE